MVKTRFVGSGRNIERGSLATHKQDFVAHVEGGDWYHGATDIQMEPSITVGSGSFAGSTVQATLEAIANTYVSGGQGFIAIGDGYENCAQDLALAFNGALANPRIANGGVILVKAGTYCIEQTVSIPAGVTVLGEPSGTVITQGNNLTIQEQPLFDIEASTLQPQTGTGMVESQNKTRFIDLIIYDNLNDYSSLTSFLVTVSFFRCQRGSDLLIDSCSIIGKAVSTANITKGVVEYVIAPSTYSTILTIQNSYIDNVATVASFNGTQGSEDWVTIKNNRLITYGTGTSDAMLTTTNANLQIVGNHHVGNNTWGSTYFVNVTAGFVANTATDFNIIGNSGGITGLSNPTLINNQPGTADVTKNNTWGGRSFSVYGIDVDSSGNTTITGDTTMSRRVIVEGETYILQNADFGTTLTFSGSRCIIDCRSISILGQEVGFDLTYTPVDGEELMITVVNHETRTPSITYIDFDTNVFFKRTQYINDDQSVDPRPGGITNFRFVYSGISQGFDLVSKTASVWSTASQLPFDYQHDELITSVPQRGFSLFRRLSVPVFSTYDDTSYTSINQVSYSKSVGALFGAGSSATTVSYTEDGSTWADIDIGTTIPGGSASRIAFTDSGSIALVSGQISSSVLRVGFNHYSFGPVFNSGTNTSVNITDTSTINTILFQGPGSNRFLVGGNDGISLLESPYTTEIAPNANTANGNNIIDMARAPDGRIMAISNGSNKIWMYIPATSGDFTTTPTFVNVTASGLLGTPRKISFNRVLNRWYIHTDNTTGYQYSEDNGASFVSTVSPSLATGPGLLRNLQMVGNTTVACYECSAGTGWGGLYYLNFSSGDWQALSVNNSDGSGYKYIGWVGGKLIAIKEYVSGFTSNPIAVCSTIEAGMYNMLDFDK